MRANAFFILIALISFSCNNRQESAMKKVEQQFKLSFEAVTNNQNLDSDVYMVIPRAGCGSCISSAESYMLESLADSSRHFLKFILTDFDSEKLLRARFGEYFKSPRIILDPENVFRSNEILTSIYPTIYFFDEDFNLVSVSSMSPTEDGIGELALYISNKNPISSNLHDQ